LAPLKLSNRYLVAVLFCVGFYLGAYVENSSVFSFLPNPGIVKPQQFYNVSGAVLIVIAVANGFGSRILRSSACQWLGKVSFAVYLVHFIVLCSVISYLYTIVSEESWDCRWCSYAFWGAVIWPPPVCDR